MLVAPTARRETNSCESIFSPEVATSIARHLLLHQGEAHVALPRRVHELDCLATRMPDDEGCAGILDRVGRDFHHCGHELPLDLGAELRDGSAGDWYRLRGLGACQRQRRDRVSATLLGRRTGYA